MKSKSQRQPVLLPLLLLAVSLLAYGWLILKPGFFGEDLSLLWLHQRSGLAGLQEYFNIKGSAQALLLSGLISAFGQNAGFYHLLAVLLRWLGAWSFWLLVNDIWPKQQGKATLAALIFLVFPALRHMPLAISILPHLLALCLTVTGFHLLHEAILEPKRRRVHFVAAGLTGVSLLLSPYFAGLEILRIAMIWKDWRRQKGKHAWLLLRKIFLTWLPFAFFLGIRIGLGFPGGETGAPFVSQISESGKAVLRSLLDMVVMAWRQVFQIPQGGSELVVYALGVLIAALLVYLALGRLNPGETENKEEKTEGKPEMRNYLLTGLAVLLAGGFPLWLSGERIGLNYPDSVTAIAFLPGAAILLAGLFDLLLLPRYQAGLAALLVALSVGAQVQNSSLFAGEWRKAESLVLQLHSRAPGMEDGSILISEQVPLNYYSSENLTALFNLVYFPNRQDADDGLLYQDAETALETARQGGRVEIYSRGFKFSGDISNGLLFFQPESGCLRLIENGRVDAGSLPKNLGEVFESNGLNSEAVLKAAPVLLPEMISEPAAPHRCILLEEIELAGTRGEWQTAAEIMESGGSILRQVDHTYELVPLAETAAHNGQKEFMTELVREAAGGESAPWELCRMMDRLEQTQALSLDVKTTLNDLKIEIHCEKK